MIRLCETGCSLPTPAIFSRYTTISLRSLALWRIALGATCSQAIVRRWAALDVFYSESGAYPRAALTRGVSWQAGPLYAVTSDTVLHIAFALCLAVALAFTFGAGTRYAKWLLLPALVTIDARVPPVFTGGEAVLHGQALYAMFLPVGARLSVDAWRAARRQEAETATATRTLVYPLLLLQLAVIYFFNTIAKMGPSWADGTAVARALGAATLVTPLGVWVGHLPAGVLRLLTRGTLVVEGSLPLLLLSPWRRRSTHAAAGLLMLALHGGIFLALEVGSFSQAMLSYVPLLWHPRDESDAVQTPARRARRLELAIVALLLYVGTGRLTRDLILWPHRPLLPMPALLNRATAALGLLQPWMMFSPDPPDRDFVIVTDAVTRSGRHFDPWRRVASGRTEPLKRLPQSVVRQHIFTRYENSLSERGRSEMHPYFARWVLAQRAKDGEPTERFDAWLLIVSTLPGRVVPDGTLDQRVGVTPLPFSDALPVRGFEARGVWQPQRAFDAKIVPEGTHVFTPVGAAMSAGCPHLTLDLGVPQPVVSAFIQADSVDYFLIEGSLDGNDFRALGEMGREQGQHYLSRVVTLTGEPARFVRLRPAQPRAMRHFLSEVALFDHPVTLPALRRVATEEFVSELGRPAVAGILSASSHPSSECPAEDPVAIAADRSR